MSSVKVVLSFVIALFGVSSILQGCGGGGGSDSNAIPAVAEGQASLSTLVAALKAADLVDTLSGTGPFTVFAPTNKAFSAVPAAELKYLLAPEQKASLQDLLKYHVASGSIESSELKNNEQVPTLDGGNLTITITKTTSNTTIVKVDDATVEKADVKASNGVVHIINGVLIPSGFSKLLKNIVQVAVADNFTTLVTAVGIAPGIASTLEGPGPFTVFAPTDAAFAALPNGTLEHLIKNPAELAKVLEYHVVKGEVTSDELKDGPVKTVEGADVTIKLSGSDVSVNNAKVTKANVFAVNGVIHVIDAVLIPPNSTAATATPVSPLHIVV
jgi:transforming growth factor-beta-induced protein